VVVAVPATLARTESGEHVALLVESDMEGFEAGERFEAMGLRGNDLRRLHFRGVRVPQENVLGQEGEGFTIVMEVLNNGQMSLGAGAVGTVRSLLDRAVEHATGRRQVRPAPG
jgi:acyl-CoA dehydrogenase family protein 9